VRKHIVANLHYLAAFLCLAFVFAFGAVNLKSDPIRHADINSWKHIGITRDSPIWSIPQTLDSVAERSSDHAPLYFVLLNIWAHITGRDLFNFRLLSLFFGMLSLAFTYRLALSSCGKGAALNAAILTASMAYFLYYSLEVRMYSLLIMLTALVACAYWRVSISTAEARGRHWLALTLASAAIINVHYFGFFVLAAIVLHHLIFAPKDRRWLQVCLAMAAAGLFFLPWLPVALHSLALRSIPDTDVLTLFEAIPAVLSPYSNGLMLPWLLVGGVFVFNYKRLGASQRYIFAIALILLGIILLANEFGDLIIARRLRYTIVLALIWNCALALALTMLPRWTWLRIPALAIWIIAGLIYSDSTDMLLYTNRLADGQEHVPPFQHLVYDPAINPRPDDFVVGVHADTPLIDIRFDFYAGKHPLGFALIHMWINEDGELETQYNDTRYPDLQSLADWDFPIWLVYNPAQTDFEGMDVYADVVQPNFQRCKRFVESENAVVDMYLAKGILCELFTDDAPLEINYDGGNHLENIATELAAGELRVSFLWAEILQNDYAFSLQVFDENGFTGVQLDAVIAGTPVHNFALDISSLPRGEYLLNLIVYGFESGKKVAGTIVESQERFQREVEIMRFSIDD